MADINLGSVPLPDREADYFKAMTNAYNWTVRTKVSDLLRSLIRENREEFDEMVSYASRKYGLTFDETFHRLLKKESLGEPLDSFSVEPAMEEKLNGLAKK